MELNMLLLSMVVLVLMVIAFGCDPHDPFDSP